MQIRDYQEKLEARQKAEKEKHEKRAAVIKPVFGDVDGIRFGRLLVEYIGLFHEDDSNNAPDLLERKAVRKLYLNLIRPYLDKETIREIET